MSPVGIGEGPPHQTWSRLTFPLSIVLRGRTPIGFPRTLAHSPSTNSRFPSGFPRLFPAYRSRFPFRSSETELINLSRLCTSIIAQDSRNVKGFAGRFSPGDLLRRRPVLSRLPLNRVGLPRPSPLWPTNASRRAFPERLEHPTCLLPCYAEAIAIPLCTAAPDHSLPLPSLPRTPGAALAGCTQASAITATRAHPRRAWSCVGCPDPPAAPRRTCGWC